MSVNIEQVREALGDMISHYGEFVGGVVYNEIGETVDLDEILKVMRDCKQMADEIEALRTLLERAQGVVDTQYSLYEDEDMLELTEAIDKVLGGNDGNT